MHALYSYLLPAVLCLSLTLSRFAQFVVGSIVEERRMPIEPLQEAKAKQAVYFFFGTSPFARSRRNREHQPSTECDGIRFLPSGPQRDLNTVGKRRKTIARKRLEQIDCANIHGPRAAGGGRQRGGWRTMVVYVNI